MPVALPAAYIAQLHPIRFSGGITPPLAFPNHEMAGLISFLRAYVLPGVLLHSVPFPCALAKEATPSQAGITAPLATLVLLVVAYAPLLGNGRLPSAS
jgi:hypothetical protein